MNLFRSHPARRKDAGARRDLLNSVDVAILCLPDEAAMEAVALIDARSQDPCDRCLHGVPRHPMAGPMALPKWNPAQRERIASANRVANPGCWPQGLIALVKPLIAAGLLTADVSLSYAGISGYSGGGKKMIEDYEAKGDARFALRALCAWLQSQASAGDEALHRPVA